MKKKIFSFALVFALMFPLIFLFSACGEKKVTNLRLENFFAGEAKVEYEYGVTLNDIISTNMQAFADFDDGTSQQLQPDEYSITYRKDGQIISHIKPIPDVGYYTLEYSYKKVGTAQSFYIIPTNNSPYTINLPQKTWTYDDSVTDPTLNNYELQEGETVTWYYISKETYDNLTDVEKRNITGYAVQFTSLSQVYAGEHYIFAKINFAQTSNYTGVTKIDENALVTVNKKTITITAEQIQECEATFTSSAQTLADVTIKYNNITLPNINNSGVLGRIVWKYPNTTISTANDQNAFQVTFEFTYEEDASNYDIICDLTLPISLQK